MRVLGGALAPSQYAGWTAGDPVALARPADTFTNAGFSPVAPVRPSPINPAPDGLPRPQPRRWQVPVGWNMPTQPGTEGMRLTSYQTLRGYADMSSIVRACLDKRIEEILGLEWDIVPTMEAELAMTDVADRKDFQERRVKAMRFFARPDPEYDTYHSWMRALLEEIFVIDALSVYIAPPRVPGKGLFGSNLAALALIDGSTIRPLQDAQGGRPQPPAVAFQQYMFGVPRVDMVDVINQSELDEDLGLPEEELRGDQLLYLPYRRRTNSPYGFSNVEACLVPTGIELSKQKYALSYYAEGNVPASWIEIGNADTPQQVKQWQDSLDATIGDVGARHQVTVLPSGSKASETKPNAFSDNYDMANKEEIFAAFGLTAMDMGMLPGGKSAGLSGGKGMAEANQSSGVRAATKPLVMFLKRALMDLVLQQYANQGDMQWHWKNLEPPADEQKKDASDIAAVTIGTMTRDEYRLARGEQAFGLALTSSPTVMTPTGGLVNLADPTAPAAGSEMPSTNEEPEPGAGDDNAPTKPGAAPGATPQPKGPDKPKPAPSGDPSKTTPLKDSMTPQTGHGHETGKMIQAELAQLANFVRHKRPVSKFTPKVMAPDMLKYIGASDDPVAAIKDITEEITRCEDPVYAAVSSDVAKTMHELWAGQMSSLAAEGAIHDIMTKGLATIGVSAPDSIDEIANLMSFGKSSADCLTLLQRYFALHRQIFAYGDEPVVKSTIPTMEYRMPDIHLHIDKGAIDARSAPAQVEVHTPAVTVNNTVQPAQVSLPKSAPPQVEVHVAAPVIPPFPPAQVEVHVAAPNTPEVKVAAPVVKVAAPVIHVRTPDQKPMRHTTKSKYTFDKTGMVDGKEETTEDVVIG